MHLNALVNSFFYSHLHTLAFFKQSDTYDNLINLTLWFLVNNNSTHVNSFINSTCIFYYNGRVIQVIVSPFGDYSTAILV